MRDSTEERRQEKLEMMAHQIKNGTLVVRKMTAGGAGALSAAPRQAADQVAAPAAGQLICGRRSAHGAAASSWAASE